MTLHKMVNGQSVQCSAEEEAAILAERQAEAARVVVPQSVTRRQAKQALLLAGLLNSVQATINAIPDATQRGLVQIEWDDSQEFIRTRPVLIALASALGLNSSQLDALFIQAAGLE